jgi:sugar phosphate isomerase/epimerase
VNVACVTNGDAYHEKMAQHPAHYIESIKETINVAKEVGADFVNCYAYHFALGQNADITRLTKVMRPIVKYAEDMDVTIVLENEAHDASGTPEGMFRILKALESDRFKTNFDPTNYYQGNVEPFPYAYEVLKDDIAYVHVKNGCRFILGTHPDYMKGASFAPPNDSNFICYTPIPDGAVNIEGFLARLKRDRYGGFCTLEPHVKTDKLMDYYKVDVSYMKQKGFK